MKSGRGNYLFYTGIVTDHFQKKTPRPGRFNYFFDNLKFQRIKSGGATWFFDQHQYGTLGSGGLY